MKVRVVLSALMVVVAMHATTLADTFCPGCDGSGDSDIVSGQGGCAGETVSIVVTVISGDCVYVPNPPTGTCEDIDPCYITITRTWDDLATGGEIEICVTIPNLGERCKQNPPTGQPGGSGSDVQSYDMECGWENWSYSVTTPCGTSASATGTCSDC
jgi:hypothetical protein